MDVIVLDQILTLETAPVHVAPGGSKMCTISGKAVDVAAMLRDLRSEVAFGMMGFRTISKDEKRVEAVVYFGAADEADYSAVASKHPNCHVELKAIHEDETHTGLSMRARNQVIHALE